MITDCNAVRLELFKLNYLRGQFVLNEKADAAACLDFVVMQMHTWMQSCTTPMDGERARLLEQPAQDGDLALMLEALAKVVKCERVFGNA